jgi:Tfp pilus assembly protein PilX
MSFTSKRREGFALAVAMVAIVVIGALIAGAFFTSTQEYRIGRNSLIDQRAFAAAEAGVTQPI